MFEEFLRNKLKERLDVPVYMERQEGLTAPFVVFEKTGGDKENRLGASTYAFQSYGGSLYNTIKLNNAVCKAIESLIEEPRISKTEYISDYNYTDLVRKEHRYQAVYQIYHY